MQDLLFFIIDILKFALTLLTYAIIIRAVLTWFIPSTDNYLSRVLYKVTEPILASIRGFLPTVGMFDLSPIVAILAIQVLQNFVLDYIAKILLGIP
ncbi:MAG: YggT family protein [Deltaproteobacteria bacterium]|nr:YggT family protein [Deltaproteobacteria bacterium]